jgi:hypothetical protein
MGVIFGDMWVRIHGASAIANGKSRVHDLAAALTRYVEDHERKFPRGTALQTNIPIERKDRPWPPQERISWMYDLLPYVGYKDHLDIKTGLPWMMGPNYLCSTVVIPEFLAPETTPETAWVEYPGAPEVGLGRSLNYATTNYAGMAGVGLDAAEYKEGDAETEAKRGIFGYDRQTKLDQISKPGNTIAVIRVPPKYKTPWIAGGGSTIRGVPEQECIKPFVCTRYLNREGTYAIMADGSVRFIFSDIPDEVFKDMCTIRGSANVKPADLEKYAPLVPRPESKPEAKPEQAQPPAKPEGKDAPKQEKPSAK